MSRVLRYSLMVIGLGLIFSVVSATQTHAQIREILRRMDDNNKSLQSLRADVTMVKTDSVLKVSDTTYGNTSYLPNSSKGRYIRIDWTKPVEEQISVIGDDYELYRPRLNQVITGKTTNSKNNASVGGALAFMSMSKDQLSSNYTVVYLGDEQISGGTQTFHLQLTPKSGDQL